VPLPVGGIFLWDVPLSRVPDVTLNPPEIHDHSFYQCKIHGIEIGYEPEYLNMNTGFFQYSIRQRAEHKQTLKPEGNFKKEVFFNKKKIGSQRN
jgi:hypothetical protein